MGTWTKTVGSGLNGFGLCGTYWNGKLFVAGYGRGAIVSYNPETEECQKGDEAVFNIVPFKGTLYAPSEQNSRSGTTRILQRTAGGWVDIPVPGYATYFMAANSESLVFSATKNILQESVSGSTIDIYQTSDGVNINYLGNTGAWIWVPVFYRNELYILGHTGECYNDGTGAAVKWNGAGWSTVSAFSTGKEWQACCEHGDYLFVGGTGQTSGRRDDTTLASVYRYDGSSLTLMKNVPGYSEVSGLASIDGVLWASFCSGFKYNDGGYATPGDCQIWYSLDNGSNWTLDATLPQPSVYAFVEFAGTIVAIGGGAEQTLYVRGDPLAPAEPVPTPTIEAPTAVTASVTGNVINVSWTAPTTNLSSVAGYEVMVQAVYSGTASPIYLYPFYNVLSPNTNVVVTPTLAGAYSFRVRSGSYGLTARERRNTPAGTTVFKYTSAWSDWSTPIQYSEAAAFAVPATPVTSMPTTSSILVTFVPCPENSNASTELYYSTATSGTILRYDTYAHSVTNATYINVSPGETYRFYIKYVLGSTVSPLSGASTTIVVPTSFNAPTNVLAVFTSPSVVQLTWQDQSVGEAVFEVERYEASSNSFVKIAELPANTTSFTDTGITNTILTRYRVRARGGLVTSDYVTSNSIPDPVAGFKLLLRSLDTTAKRIYYGFTTSAWTSYNNSPAYVVIDISEDGVSFTEYVTLGATDGRLWQTTDADKATAYISYVNPERLMYVRATAINGAGVVLSNILTLALVPTFYTTPTPPLYDPGTAYGESLVWTKDGAGEAEYALSGLVNLNGITYAATTTSIGLLDKEVQEAEIITQPMGEEWYGGKNVYVAELEASTNRDIMISIGSRSDYKDVSFSYGKEVSFHKTGKTGYFKSGNEFEVKLKWNSGYSHYLKLYGGRLWVKLTKQAMQTVPFFFGKRGYDPGKGAK